MSDPRPISPHNEKKPLLTSSQSNYLGDLPTSSPSPSQHFIDDDEEPLRRMNNNNDDYSFRADAEIVINEDRIGSVRKGLSFAKLAKSIPDGEDSFPTSKNSDEQSFWQKVKIRFPYYVPVAGWLPNYDVKKSLFKDVVAGLAVSSLLIPQVYLFNFNSILNYRSTSFRRLMPRLAI